MKRGWYFLLLVSLGLNLGLGLRVVRGPAPEEPSGRAAETRTRGMGPRGWSVRDTAALQERIGRRESLLAERLQLDDRQIAAFREARRATGTRVHEQRNLVHESRRNLYAVVARDTVQPAEVRRAIAEVGRRQAILDSLVSETMMREMEVLEPRQRVGYLRLMGLERGAGRGLGRRNGADRGMK